MLRPPRRLARLLRLFALVIWIASFALPTIDMGGGNGAAPGVLAAYFAAVLPLFMFALARAGGPAAGALPFAIVVSLYFPVLAVANLLVPLAFARRARVRGWVRRALPFAAVLATGVVLVPWPLLWTTLELASGERVRLEAGYVLWLVSFWLMTLASREARTAD